MKRFLKGLAILFLIFNSLILLLFFVMYVNCNMSFMGINNCSALIEIDTPLYFLLIDIPVSFLLGSFYMLFTPLAPVIVFYWILYLGTVIKFVLWPVYRFVGLPITIVFISLLLSYYFFIEDAYELIIGVWTIVAGLSFFYRRRLALLYRSK